MSSTRSWIFFAILVIVISIGVKSYRPLPSSEAQEKVSVKPSVVHPEAVPSAGAKLNTCKEYADYVLSKAVPNSGVSVTGYKCVRDPDGSMRVVIECESLWVSSLDGHRVKLPRDATFYVDIDDAVKYEGSASNFFFVDRLEPKGSGFKGCWRYAAYVETRVSPVDDLRIVGQSCEHVTGDARIHVFLRLGTPKLFPSEDEITKSLRIGRFAINADGSVEALDQNTSRLFNVRSCDRSKFPPDNCVSLDDIGK